MNDRVESQNIAGEVRQLISFTVGEEEYGLELQHVREVIRMREVTWLPETPSYVRGIISLRGQVIPIIDLRERFRLEATAVTAATRVIVVEVGGLAVGMVVDSASEVIRLLEDQFEQPPSLLGRVSQQYITAVGKLENRLIVLLDVERILKEEVRTLTSDLEQRGEEQLITEGVPEAIV